MEPSRGPEGIKDPPLRNEAKYSRKEAARGGQNRRQTVCETHTQSVSATIDSSSSTLRRRSPPARNVTHHHPQAPPMYVLSCTVYGTRRQAGRPAEPCSLPD